MKSAGRRYQEHQEGNHGSSRISQCALLGRRPCRRVDPSEADRLAGRDSAGPTAPTTGGSQPLAVVDRTLEINGKAAKVFGIMRPDGRSGLVLDPGALFDVALSNRIAEPTLIHWHGLTPPWPMDGVPDKPAPMLKPGETRTYAFPVADPGTYWMHAHTLQEQNLLAAPLIVHSASDAGKDEQEVVVLLHDFSFTPAEELLARLTKGAGKSGTSMGGMDMGGMAETMVGMSHEDLMKHMAQMRGMTGGSQPARNDGRHGPQRHRLRRLSR